MQRPVPIVTLLFAAIVLTTAVALFRSQAIAHAADAASQAGLPWSQSQSWYLTGGPHTNNGVDSGPYNSLDFSGGDAMVRVARGGNVHFDSCGPNAGYVRIDHLDGYSTTYYHLTNIPAFTDGQPVTAGQYLGNQGIVTACGGPPLCSTCAHVHFSLWYTPPGTQFVWISQQQGVDLNNVQLGDWIVTRSNVVFNGTRLYNGCMWPIFGGPAQCHYETTGQNGTISNSGRIGGSAPALTSGASIAAIHGSASNQGYWTSIGSGLWNSLGGGLVGNPNEGVFNNDLHVFARGLDGQIYWRTQSPASTGNWSPSWIPLSGLQIASDPVVTVYQNSVQVYARGTDGQVWQRYYYWSGSSWVWSTWNALGGFIYGNPAVGTVGTRLQILARGGDNAMWQKYYNGGWSGWSTLGGFLTSDAAPGLPIGNGSLQVLARGEDGALWQDTEGPEGTWSGWQRLGGGFVGSPAAVALGSNFFVFVHWTDGNVSQNVWNGSSWSGWQSQQFPVTATSDPVVGVSNGWLELEVRGSDGAAWHSSYADFYGWTFPSSMGGTLS